MTKSATKAPDCVMVSLRDQRVTSTLGHTVFMQANVPMRVPGPLVDQAASQGCIPADSNEYEAHKQKAAAAAAANKVFEKAIIDAISTLVKRNNYKDFTSSGHPRIDSLAAEIGIEPGSISEQTRDLAFAKWQEINKNLVAHRRAKLEATAASTENEPAPAAIESADTGLTEPAAADGASPLDDNA